ncbi:putative ubiquitin-activating enzyme subunit [Calocera cornea HHB12733]|uniref:NEDD8-activating enzyme E1 regulatory subunit n=1 Tax=Calocera cornea HHB12733 TaxID=1353952 RepID=A0A165D9W8_9BASI|nr:putative ubiquitin-activating enzyme subunit [Calocera cornea HHB12733]
MSQTAGAQSIPEATVTVAPANARPDDKTRRYDRQLRLWASSGQSALESARILVVSGGATSTSTLKNLVLPGIGAFTILDHFPVTYADAGNNFFLHIDGVGKNRAEEGVKHLAELNDSVKGTADIRDVNTLLDSDPDFFTSFTLVIAVNLVPATEDRLAQALRSGASTPREMVPLMIVRTAGLYAMIGTQIGEHTVVDAHAETPPSLRLDSAFPALLEYSRAVDLDALDSTDFGHVPWIVLLVKTLDNWRQTHDGQMPKTYAEKQELKKQLEKMRRRGDEENFDEAVAQAYRMWTPTTVPSETRDLLTDQSVTTLTASSPSIFYFLRALSLFVNQYGFLPLVPTLPDMHTTTSTYVELQNLFRAQAEQETLLFENCLKTTVEEVKGSWDERESLGLGRAEVKEFIRNAAGVRVFKGRKWGSVQPAEIVSALQNDLESGMLPAPAAVYSAFLASADFYGAHGRHPRPTDADNAELLQFATRRLTAGGWEGELPETVTTALGEIARAQGSDIPTTAALVGGMVAQEAIKFITRQYVPIAGTCMVDLIKSTTGTLPF